MNKENFLVTVYITNFNYGKFIKQAINYEAKRQIEVLESGGSIEQNTMLFNTSTGKTRPMRNKEEAHDYRYFPDPDLLPLEISKEEIGKIKSSIPELPDELKNKFIETYKLSNYDASVLTAEKQTSDYFNQLILAVISVIMVGIGGGIYLVSNLGAGPRDGLMIGLQKVTNLPVAAVRAFLEISVVSIGWYLGGTVGVGTLLFAFGIGPCVALGLFLVDKIFD